MSEEIKNDDYSVFAHAFEGIRSKIKHFHSYMNSRQGLYICITLSNSGDLAKDSEKQETTSYFCDHF